MNFLSIVLTHLVVLLLATSAHAGGIKSWVDEHGVTHYGAAVPPQYRDKAHRVLSKDGVEINRIGRAKTPEEIKQERARQALRQEQEILKKKQEADDRILLSLYRNEDDLVMARDGKIAQLDGQIRLTYNEIRRKKTRLSEFQAIAAASERSGKNLSRSQKANLESIQQSIAQSYEIILGKEEEKRMILDSYNKDLERFRQLRRGGTRSENADRIIESEFPDLVDTAVGCVTPNECNRLWETAQAYAKRHATTPIDLSAERIMVTAPARELRDLSITVSRLANRDSDGERIFMDVQCSQFTEGREFCRGTEVMEIRNNFKLELNRALAASL